VVEIRSPEDSVPTPEHQPPQATPDMSEEEAQWEGIPPHARNRVGAYDLDSAGGCG
jgi:hypothetical protein